MRAVSVTLEDRELFLVFNGAAMFEAEELFGGSSAMVKAVYLPGREGMDALCKAVAMLSAQGAAVRRYMGYDAPPPISEEEIKVLAGPGDLLRLGKAVNRAVTVGYGRDVDDKGDVDLGLVELRQKKTKN